MTSARARAVIGAFVAEDFSPCISTVRLVRPGARRSGCSSQYFMSTVSARKSPRGILGVPERFVVGTPYALT